MIEVISRHNGTSLGDVKWYAKWRQYTFFPGPATLYDCKCLREIAEYCEFKTKEHKISRGTLTPDVVKVVEA